MLELISARVEGDHVGGICRQRGSAEAGNRLVVVLHINSAPETPLLALVMV